MQGGNGKAGKQNASESKGGDLHFDVPFMDRVEVGQVQSKKVSALGY